MMFVIEGMSAETSQDLFAASAPATAFGTKPVASMASLIRRSVLGDTFDGFDSARETVTCDTPAMRPTAAIVTRLPAMLFSNLRQDPAVAKSHFLKQLGYRDTVSDLPATCSLHANTSGASGQALFKTLRIFRKLIIA